MEPNRALRNVSCAQTCRRRRCFQMAAHSSLLEAEYRGNGRNQAAVAIWVCRFVSWSSSTLNSFRSLWYSSRHWRLYRCCIHHIVNHSRMKLHLLSRSGQLYPIQINLDIEIEYLLQLNEISLYVRTDFSKIFTIWCKFDFHFGSIASSQSLMRQPMEKNGNKCEGSDEQYAFLYLKRYRIFMNIQAKESREFPDYYFLFSYWISNGYSFIFVMNAMGHRYTIG